MMASLVVGLDLLISVCVELILRATATLLGQEARLVLIADAAVMGSE